MKRLLILVPLAVLALAIWALGVAAYVRGDTVLGTALILFGALIATLVVSLHQRQGRDDTEGTIIETIIEFFGSR